jgi:hypothetical protein
MPVTMAPMCSLTLVIFMVWAGACITALMAHLLGEVIRNPDSLSDGNIIRALAPECENG